MGTTEVCKETIHEPRMPTEEELSHFSQSSLQDWMDDDGISFEEAVRRFIASGEVEDLLYDLQATHGELIDTFFLQHPEFIAVIRTFEQKSVRKLCTLVSDWPMTVAIQWGAPYTNEELDRAYRKISDWIFDEHAGYAPGGVRIFGVGRDDSGNSVVIMGPEEPPPGTLEDLSGLGGGVYVRWELQTEIDTPRLLPESPSPSTGDSFD
jgi:hypothetical protein